MTQLVRPSAASYLQSLSNLLVKSKKIGENHQYAFHNDHPVLPGYLLMIEYHKSTHTYIYKLINDITVCHDQERGAYRLYIEQ